MKLQPVVSILLFIASFLFSPRCWAQNTITVPLTLPAGAKPLELVLIPHGKFLIGSPDSVIEAFVKETGIDGYRNEGPQHWVTISKDFYIGKYEVTLAQYQAVIGNNPAHDYEVGSDYPVYYVSWYDAVKFCNKLSRMRGLTPMYNESDWTANMNANGFRLPTEAEWEYTCRAGTTTPFYWGNDLDYALIKDYTWYDGNNNPNGTKRVGLKKPNAWGLYDMSGNVWEWCQDQYGSYSSGAAADPIGPQFGSGHVERGGGRRSHPRVVRSASRGNRGGSGYDLGFRIVASRN